MAPLDQIQSIISSREVPRDTDNWILERGIYRLASNFSPIKRISGILNFHRSLPHEINLN